MNNNVSRKFTSPKWEVKNTYLRMPARRPSGGPDLTFLVNSLGLPR